MIFMYKESCYCLTDWLRSPLTECVQRRVIGPMGNALYSDYIRFMPPIFSTSEYTLEAAGLLKEPFELYVLYNKEALIPVRKYDGSLKKAKDQLDDFLLRIDNLRAFI